MEIFLVGGAVRDKLLGYPSDENDWVIVGAQEKELLDQGFVNVGKDFPVFLHPQTKEEYALARKERKTGFGYTGFEFDTQSNVTLEEDLSRRDLTINAIAKDRNGNLIDPYKGKHDIDNRILRHVSSAFAEDPVRVLRLARLAARYHHLDFTVAKETIELIHSMVTSGELDHLVAERVWKEFEKALGEQNPEIFIQVLRDCKALKIIMPELDALFGVPQPEKHHPEIDTGIHSLMSLLQACRLSRSKEVRFAALVHDFGKALTPTARWPRHHGHEQLGLTTLSQFCDRLKVPNEYRTLAQIVMDKHTHCHRAFELKPESILKLFSHCDAYRRPERFSKFLLCCKADARGRSGFEESNYPQANYLQNAFEQTKMINVKQFVESGLKGKEIGEAIRKARLEILRNLVASQKATRRVTKKDQTEK